MKKERERQQEYGKESNMKENTEPCLEAGMAM